MADSGGTIELGGVSFRIGVNLTEFSRDLQRAEELARSRVATIQQHFDGLKVSAAGMEQQMQAQMRAAPRMASAPGQMPLPGFGAAPQMAAPQQPFASGPQATPTASVAPIERIRPIKTRDYHTTVAGGGPEPVAPPVPVAQQRQIETRDVRTSIAPQTTPAPPSPTVIIQQARPSAMVLSVPTAESSQPYTQVPLAGGGTAALPSRLSPPTQTQRQVPPVVSGVPAAQRPLVHLPPRRTSEATTAAPAAPTTAAPSSLPAAPAAASVPLNVAPIQQSAQRLTEAIASGIDQAAESIKGQFVRFAGGAGARLEGKVTSESGGTLGVNVGGATHRVPRSQAQLISGLGGEPVVPVAAEAVTPPVSRAQRHTAPPLISPTPPALPRSGQPPRVHFEQPEEGAATQAAYVLAPQGIYRATVPTGLRRAPAQQVALGQYFSGAERVAPSQFPPYARFLEQQAAEETRRSAARQTGARPPTVRPGEAQPLPEFPVAAPTPVAEPPRVPLYAPPNAFLEEETSALPPATAPVARRPERTYGFQRGPVSSEITTRGGGATLSQAREGERPVETPVSRQEAARQLIAQRQRARGSSSTRYTEPSLIPALARGGKAHPNQMHLVGEEGPEIFVPKTSGYVLSHDQTERVFAQARAQGGDVQGSFFEPAKPQLPAFGTVLKKARKGRQQPQSADVSQPDLFGGRGIERGEGKTRAEQLGFAREEMRATGSLNMFEHLEGRARGGPVASPAFARQEITRRLETTGLAPAHEIGERFLKGATGPAPKYLDPARRFLEAQTERLASGRVTETQVAAAYLTTLSSIHGGEISRATAEARAGMQLPESAISTVRGRESLRPEDSFALWLQSPGGQKALRDIRDGHVEQVRHSIEAARQAQMSGHGFPSFKGKRNAPAPLFLPPASGQFSLANIHQATEEFNRAGAAGERIEPIAARFAGIGAGKTGFLAQWLGSGRFPTLDVNALSTWLGPEGGKLAEKALGAKAGQRELGPKLQQAVIERHREMQALGYLQGVAQEQLPALMHWTLFDAAKLAQTSHQPILDLLTHAGQERRHGGRVEHRQQGGPVEGERIEVQPQPTRRQRGGQRAAATRRRGQLLTRAAPTQQPNPFLLHAEPGEGRERLDVEQLMAHYEQLEEQQGRVREQMLSHEARLESGVEFAGQIERPPELVGWSDAEIIAYARQEGLNPYDAGWFKHYRGEAAEAGQHRPRGRIAHKQIPSAAKYELQQLQQEYSHLEAALQQLRKYGGEALYRAVPKAPSMVPSVAAELQATQAGVPAFLARRRAATPELRRVSVAEAAPVQAPAPPRRVAPQAPAESAFLRREALSEEEIADLTRGTLLEGRLRSAPEVAPRVSSARPEAAAPIETPSGPPPSFMRRAREARRGGSGSFSFERRSAGGPFFPKYGPSFRQRQAAREEIAKQVRASLAAPQQAGPVRALAGHVPAAPIQQPVAVPSRAAPTDDLQTQALIDRMLDGPVDAATLREQRQAQAARIRDWRQLATDVSQEPEVREISERKLAHEREMGRLLPRPSRPTFRPGYFTQAADGSWTAVDGPRVAPTPAPIAPAAPTVAAAIPTPAPAQEVISAAASAQARARARFAAPKPVSEQTQRAIDFLTRMIDSRPAQTSEGSSDRNGNILRTARVALQQGTGLDDLEKLMRAMGMPATQVGQLIVGLTRSSTHAAPAAHVETATQEPPPIRTVFNVSATGLPEEPEDGFTSVAERDEFDRQRTAAIGTKIRGIAAEAKTEAAARSQPARTGTPRAAAVMQLPPSEAQQIIQRLGARRATLSLAEVTVRSGLQAGLTLDQIAGVLQRAGASTDEAHRTLQGIRHATAPAAPAQSGHGLLSRLFGRLGRPTTTPAQRLKSYLTPRAAGGPTESHAYLVGEAGPEIFVPHAAGYVLAHDQAKRAVAEGRLGRLSHRALGGQVTEAQVIEFLERPGAPSETHHVAALAALRGGVSLGELPNVLTRGSRGGIRPTQAQAIVGQLQEQAHPLAPERAIIQQTAQNVAEGFHAPPGETGAASAARLAAQRNEFNALVDLNKKYETVIGTRKQDVAAIALQNASSLVLQRRTADLTAQNQALGLSQPARGVLTRARTELAEVLPSEGEDGGGAGGTTGGAGGGGRRSTLRIFGQTPALFIREAAAVVGLNLGLSVMVGAARQFHQLMADTVDETLRLQQSTTQLGVAFGQAGQQQLRGGFAGFQAAPLVAQTQASFQQTATSFAPVANQLSISNEQVLQLTTSSAQLAQIWGTTAPQAAQVLQNVLRGNVQAGQELNLNLVDQYGRIRDLGLSYQELASVIGPAAATQRVFAVTQQAVTEQVDRYTQSASEQTRQIDQLARAWAAFQTQLGESGSGPITAILTDLNNDLQGVGSTLNQVSRAGRRAAGGGVGAQSAYIVGEKGPELFVPGSSGVELLGHRAEGGPVQQVLNTAGRALESIPAPAVPLLPLIVPAGGAVVAASRALQGFTQTQPNTTAAIARGGGGAVGIAAGLVSDSLTGVARSVGRIDRQLDDAADHLPGPIAGIVRSLTAGDRELKPAVEELISQTSALAQNPPGQPTAGPPSRARNVREDTEAQRAQTQIADRTAGITQATLQRSQGETRITEANARLSQIGAQSELRRLDASRLGISVDGQRVSAAEALNRFAMERLQLENQVVPVQLQQQQIQDQISIRTQENLELRRNLLEAQRAELPTGAAVERLGFQNQQARLQAQVALQDRMAGRAPTYDIGEQFRTIFRTSEFFQAPAKLEDLRAQQNVYEAGLQTQTDQFSKAIDVIPLEEQQQANQRSVLMYQEQINAAQASSDAVTRVLSIADLIADPARIQAQKDLNQATLDTANAAQKIAQAAVALIQGFEGTPVVQNAGEVAPQQASAGVPPPGAVPELGIGGQPVQYAGAQPVAPVVAEGYIPPPSARTVVQPPPVALPSGDQVQVQVTIEPGSHTTLPVTIQAAPRQHGGSASMSGAYLVGEGGPELFVPSQSGHVYSHAQTANILGARQMGGDVQGLLNAGSFSSSGAGGGGSNEWHVHLSMGDVSLGSGLDMETFKQQTMSATVAGVLQVLRRSGGATPLRVPTSIAAGRG